MTTDQFVYLTVQEVCDINARIVGVDNIVDLHLVESAVNGIRQTFDGRDLYPDLWSKAGALLRGLSRSHGFVNGHKRTAWKACSLFLTSNNRALRPVTPIQAEVFVLAVTQKLITDAQVVEWLRDGVGSSLSDDEADVIGGVDLQEKYLVTADWPGLARTRMSYLDPSTDAQGEHDLIMIRFRCSRYGNDPISGRYPEHGFKMYVSLVFAQNLSMGIIKALEEGPYVPGTAFFRER